MACRLQAKYRQLRAEIKNETLKEATNSEAVSVCIPMMIYTMSHIRTHISETIAFEFLHVVALQGRRKVKAELALRTMRDGCGAEGSEEGGGVCLPGLSS
jgi:hypothetical protein